MTTLRKSFALLFFTLGTSFLLPGTALAGKGDDAPRACQAGTTVAQCAAARSAAYNATPLKLKDAVALVESRLGGTVVSIEFQGKWNSPQYEVHLLTANSAFEVIVDARTGAVLNSREKCDD